MVTRAMGCEYANKTAHPDPNQSDPACREEGYNSSAVTKALNGADLAIVFLGTYICAKGWLKRIISSVCSVCSVCDVCSAYDIQ